MRNISKYMVCVIAATLGMSSIAHGEVKDIQALFMYDNHYSVVDTQAERDESLSGWVENPQLGGTYYYLNGAAVPGINKIDGKNYLFDSTGKLLDNDSEEYKQYMAKIESIYEAKKEHNADFTMDLTGMSDYDKYMLLTNYNYIYLLGDMDLYYSGCKIQGDQLTIVTPNVELEDKCASLLAKLAGIETLSEEDRARQIHDVIIDNFDYDYSFKNYGGIIEAFNNDNKFVCIGYATMFDTLCQKFDLESKIITGESYGQGHAWNKVKIKGTWKYVDCTWDDAEDNRYTWFLKSAKDFSYTHKQY